jgi:hypothetical protein
MLRLVGCLGKTMALVLLVGVIALAWIRGPELVDKLRGGMGDDAGEEGDALADDALAEAVIARYRNAIEEDSSSISFTDREIEAVLRHRLADRIPRGGTDPSVRFESGEIFISTRIPRDSLPLPADLEPGRRLLPRRVGVELRGVLLSTATGPVFVVRRVRVAGLGVPRRISDRVIDHLREGEVGTLPPSALPIQLPAEAGEAYIHEDRLVLADLP